MDEKLRARVTEDYEKWAKQPNRYDVKGIDYPQRKKQKHKLSPIFGWKPKISEFPL